MNNKINIVSTMEGKLITRS